MTEWSRLPKQSEMSPSINQAVPVHFCDLAQCGVAATAGTETVRAAGKLRLIIRLQQEADYLADQLIRPRRHAERASVSRSSSECRPAHWLEPVALVAHRIDDAPDLGQRHAVRGFPVGPGRHRPMVGVHPPVGQQVQMRIEQLPVQLLHGRPRLPRSRRTSSTVSALCITHTLPVRISGHLAPFALRTAFPSPWRGVTPATTTGPLSP